MANFANSVSFNSNYVKMGIYNFTTTSTGDNYIHFKSNVQLATYIMTYLEMVGHNYSLSAPVRAAWVSYSYTYLISGVSNYYSGFGNGVTSDGVYLAADNYLVYRARISTTTVDMSVTFNAIHANPTGAGHNFQITAAARNSVSGAYY